MAAGQVIKAEVHQQNVTEVCCHGSDAKEPTQTLVKVLCRCAGSAVTHQRLNGCYLDIRSVLREEDDMFQVSAGRSSRNFSITSSPGEQHERKRKLNLNSHRSTHPAWYNHSFDHPRQSQVIETQHTALCLLQANQQSRPGKEKRQHNSGSDYVFSPHKYHTES